MQGYTSLQADMVLYTHIRLLLYTHISLAAERRCTHVCYATVVARPRQNRTGQQRLKRLKMGQETGCGAASSAPRSGRGGRRCEACHPDHEGAWCNSSTAVSKTPGARATRAAPASRTLQTDAASFRPPPRAAVAGRGSCALFSLAPASSWRRWRRARSCPGPHNTYDRIAQQRERQRAVAISL
jgi:hypothetical protein